MAKNNYLSSESQGPMLALNHPVRRLILRIFDEHRTAVESPNLSPREMAEKLGLPLSNVSYHVRQLTDAGTLKLVSTQPVRGAVQHNYQLSEEFLGEPWVRQLLKIMEKPDRKTLMTMQQR